MKKSNIGPDLLQDIENELKSFKSFNVVDGLMEKYQPLTQSAYSDLKTYKYNY
jgi:hypothetical protein